MRHAATRMSTLPKRMCFRLSVPRSTRPHGTGHSQMLDQKPWRISRAKASPWSWARTFSAAMPAPSGLKTPFTFRTTEPPMSSTRRAHTHRSTTSSRRLPAFTTARYCRRPVPWNGSTLTRSADMDIRRIESVASFDVQQNITVVIHSATLQQRVKGVLQSVARVLDVAWSVAPEPDHLDAITQWQQAVGKIRTNSGGDPKDVVVGSEKRLAKQHCKQQQICRQASLLDPQAKRLRQALERMAGRVVLKHLDLGLDQTHGHAQARERHGRRQIRVVAREYDEAKERGAVEEASASMQIGIAQLADDRADNTVRVSNDVRVHDDCKVLGVPQAVPVGSLLAGSARGDCLWLATPRKAGCCHETGERGRKRLNVAAIAPVGQEQAQRIVAHSCRGSIADILDAVGHASGNTVPRARARADVKGHCSCCEEATVGRKWVVVLVAPLHRNDIGWEAKCQIVGVVKEHVCPEHHGAAVLAHDLADLLQIVEVHLIDAMLIAGLLGAPLAKVKRLVETDVHVGRRGKVRQQLLQQRRH
eukprot:m.160532 g.160532  ORF g.160532 m.160532 type:complete len:532 (+) comp10275_c0_seq9:1286-2881(+)